MQDDRLTEYGNKVNINMGRDGVDLYYINKDARSITQLFIQYRQPINYHYVTVTGIFIDKNAAEGEDVFLRVQSWGDEYYINYSEFINFNDSYNFCEGYLIFVN